MTALNADLESLAQSMLDRVFLLGFLELRLQLENVN